MRGVVVLRARLRGRGAPRGRARSPSGVSREVADRAQAAVVDSVPLSGAGDRGFWELSGGILRCGGCGLHMQVHAVKSGGRVYHYLRCPLNQRATLEKCPVNARVLAERLEETVWRFVIGLLTDPGWMVEGVDRLIEEERSRLRGDPEQEMRGLRRQMRDLEVRRGRAQEAYLAGAFSVDELPGQAAATGRGEGGRAAGAGPL